MNLLLILSYHLISLSTWPSFNFPQQSLWFFCVLVLAIPQFSNSFLWPNMILRTLMIHTTALKVLGFGTSQVSEKLYSTARCLSVCITSSQFDSALTISSINTIFSTRCIIEARFLHNSEVAIKLTVIKWRLNSLACYNHLKIF